MADDDNDVQMSTEPNADSKDTNAMNIDPTDSTIKDDNIIIDNKNPTENKSVEPTQTNDQTNDQNNETESNKNANDKQIKEDEEKKECDNTQNTNNMNGNNFGMNPLMLVQSAMNDFLNEMNAADIKATTLYHTHIEKQQRLMNQFVADSLKLMHEFNMGLYPIHNVLQKLKSPLQDVLLS